MITEIILNRKTLMKVHVSSTNNMRQKQGTSNDDC